MLNCLSRITQKNLHLLTGADSPLRFRSNNSYTFDQNMKCNYIKPEKPSSVALTKSKEVKNSISKFRCNKV